MFNKDQVILAPMAGVADRAFREICRSHGCEVTVSEMVSAKALYYGDRKTNELMERDQNGTFIIQLFGSDPDICAWAAEKVSPLCDVIDVNMGCPVKKIVKNGDGSALMGNEELAKKIIQKMVQATDKPITVKIRRGIREETCVCLAKNLEEAGASAIAVHGRFAEQMYSGAADWDCIRRVKEAVSIPVIANGDVTDSKSYLAIREATGCRHVMIGRGTLGNPWIFDEITAKLANKVFEAPSVQEKMTEAIRHLELMRLYRGEKLAVIESRKHMAWYIRGVRGAAQLRDRLNAMTSCDEIIEALSEIR